MSEMQYRQEVSNLQCSGFRDILGFAAVAAIFGVLGAGIPSAVWGTMYSLFDAVPKFMGFSRFWLDMISGGAGGAIIFICAALFSEKYGELSNDGKCDVTLGLFFLEYPIFSIVTVIVAAIIALCCVCGQATWLLCWLIAIVLVAIVVLMCLGISRLAKRIGGTIVRAAGAACDKLLGDDRKEDEEE